MTMEFQIPSFVFGLIIGLALMLLVGQSYHFFFGGKRARELAREVDRLRKAIEQKDRYIRKSLDALKEEGLTLPAPVPDSESRSKDK